MICLTLCFLFRYLPLQGDTHYISLGRDCQVSCQLALYNLRSAAYPLDWIVSHHFEGVIEVFKDDFNYFLDPAFLEYKTTYIENTYYQFLYNHFFPVVGYVPKEDIVVKGTIVPNYLDYLPNVQATQGRRIQRLMNLLSSKERIIFIRSHSTPDEARAFMRMLKEKYPHPDIFLVVVHERKDLIGDWHIPNVLNFYASQKSGFADWWEASEWAKIFSHIQDWLNNQAVLYTP
ncbi:DUF1796 family putative cysteine peptidase [Candidatus Protochlamydia phocaeensis]|uniref:DUF1796 family putative cysteine peptidase n=1 Tax=Candidatus Protochlamydia phocaeensis TaxID=1414722 RepID=UPI00189677DD|nr:DUF1796 family putative cysteine peptidase [Candidatus Protochlamydia phocaeensis]